MIAVPELLLDALVDPVGTLPKIQEAALLDTNSAEDREALRCVLQAWWDTCEDAFAMLNWEFHVAPGGMPRERSRVTLLACLCARTSAHRAGHMIEAVEYALDLVEAWCFGEHVDLQSLRYNLGEQLRPASGNEAASDAIQATIGAILSACSDVKSRINFANHAACSAANSIAHGSTDHVENSARHVRDIADLIRSAVPNVPFPERSP